MKQADNLKQEVGVPPPVLALRNLTDRLFLVCCWADDERNKGLKKRNKAYTKALLTKNITKNVELINKIYENKLLEIDKTVKAFTDAHDALRKKILDKFEDEIYTLSAQVAEETKKQNIEHMQNEIKKRIEMNRVKREKKLKK